MEINVAKLILTIERYYTEHEELLKYIPTDQFCEDTGIKRSTFKPWGGFRKFYTEYTNFKCLRNRRAIILLIKQMKAIEKEYEYASMNLYIQLHNRGHLHHDTLVRWFGDLIKTRYAIDMEVSDLCFHWCFDHTEEEYRTYFSKIQKECGYISESLVNATKGITMKAIKNCFHSLENACKQLGFIYKADPIKKSKLQQKAEAIFQEFTGLSFMIEKTWKWLVYKKNMRVDIYCPAMNLAIEVDGAQHYEQIDYFHKTSEKFWESVRRDVTKDFLLKIHKIKLLRLTEKSLEVLPMLLMALFFEFNVIYDLCAF